MNMTIKTLEIIAFKGIQHLLLEPDGHNAVISGRNGTGKTSVCDAFLWLLFGKDSAGNKADVKPRNNLGERVEGLESDVRAVLTVDGRDIELRRQWHEVWSKDPASGEKVYSRDETLCWIDGVPVKLEKEYTPYVLGLVGGDENTFKLLTDLGAFMRLNWADRRRELVKIAGGDPDAELRMREEYCNIDDILRGASPEDAKKRLLEQRRTLETELKTLPARIDELEKTMQPVTDAEVAEARNALTALQAELDDAEALLTVAPETLKRANDLYARKRELETRRAEIERSLRQPIDEALSAAEGKLATIRRTEASLASDQLMALDELRRLGCVRNARLDPEESGVPWRQENPDRLRWPWAHHGALLRGGSIRPAHSQPARCATESRNMNQAISCGCGKRGHPYVRGRDHITAAKSNIRRGENKL